MLNVECNTAAHKAEQDTVMHSGRIFDIQRGSFVDGPGIRTVVFFKGCELRCKWCHNPESWVMESQIMYYRNKCRSCLKCVSACPQHAISKSEGSTDGPILVTDKRLCNLCGRCEEVCMYDARKLCGRDAGVDEIMIDIVKDKPFYESTGGGVTFSGGECMQQINFLAALLMASKANGINTAVDTAGNTDFSYFDRIIPYTDLFLYDLKCINDKLHIKNTGVSNRIILENLGRLLNERPRNVWVRIPAIPGFNTDDDELRRISDFLSAYPQPAKIELMPYHNLGESKRTALGMAAESKGFMMPSKDDLDRYKKLLCLS